MATITKISAQKRPGRYNIFLDEQYAFPVSEEVLIKYGLRKGIVLDEAAQDELKKADADTQAYQLALSYLSYQLRTVKEMTDYLRDHDVSADTAADVIARLQKQGYMDDGEYARAYIRTNMRLSLKGPAVLAQELKRRGIRDQNQLEDALLQYDQATLIENGTKLAQQVWQRQHNLSGYARQQKARQALQTKGYRGDDLQLFWADLDFELDAEEEDSALTLAAQKAARHYRPLTERKQLQKFKQALMRKGFNFDQINGWLDEHLDELD
ncbi:recombination regulator RecX [Lapidilactobacillus achengensis]|uniref:Regulatory protein RecX n=1 Tax=Lapidilactobacillus achengensis TaxID=2486000 RepID=A0ABW1UMP6_9LACO|nr:recombination regulator RecX [Lapidilactobacillus achengensis]